MTKISFVLFWKNEMCKWALANFEIAERNFFLAEEQAHGQVKSADKT